MAWYRCTGGGSAVGKGMSLVDYSENAYATGVPSATWTSKTFTAEANDIFIIAVISRGNVTSSGFSLVDSQEFGGAGDKLQILKKVSSGGTEQFSVAFANRVRDEIMIYQFRGVSNLTKTTGTYNNNSVTSISVNMGSRKSFAVIAKRYTSYQEKEFVYDDYNGISGYAQKTPANGSWLFGIISNETIINNSFTVSVSNTPFAMFVYSIS